MPASASVPLPSARRSTERKLLLGLGAAMVATGQPVYEVEQEVGRVAAKLGYPNVEVAAMPTSVMVALSPGEAASLQVVRESLRLDQIADVNVIRRGLVSQRLGTTEALNQLARLSASKPRFGRWGLWVGFPVVATGICMIMQPGIANVIATFLLSFLTVALMRLAGRLPGLGNLLPPLAAFLVSVLALYAAQQGWLVGPLRTIMCPLAILLPGATLATGMAELAGGMVVAGSSRLVYGIVKLMLFTIGVVAGAALLRVDLGLLSNVRVNDLPVWTPALGLVMISIGMVLAENLPLRFLPYSLTVLAMTFGLQLGIGSLGMPTAAAFLAAAAAAFASSLIEASRPNVPRLVTFLPSFWLLVPGTLGVIGITQLSTPGHAQDGIIVAASLIVAIALGLLVGSALGRPLYALGRRVRARAQRRPADHTTEQRAPSDLGMPG